jgi:hypothetical protein
MLASFDARREIGGDCDKGAGSHLPGKALTVA